MTACQHPRTLVRETRRVDGQVYRRRQCRDCNANFVTVETRDGEQPAPGIPRRRTDEQRKRDAAAARRRRGGGARVERTAPRGDGGAMLQAIWR